MKENYSGIDASLGFKYQDYVTLAAVIPYLTSPSFEGVKVEGNNDFEIILRESEVSGQAKSQKLTFKEIGKFVSNFPDNKGEYVLWFEGTSSKKSNKSLEKQYISNYTDDEIRKAFSISSKDVIKIRKCKFKLLPLNTVDKFILGEIAEVLSAENLPLQDMSLIERNLLFLMARGRSEHLYISKQKIWDIILSAKNKLDISNLVAISENNKYMLDLLDVIKYFIDNTNLSLVRDLEELKLLISLKKSQAMVIAQRLAAFNENYKVLLVGTKILFGEYTDCDFPIINDIEPFQRLVKSMTAFKNEKFDNALEYIKNVVETDLHTNLPFLKGLILFNLSKYGDAIRNLQKAVLEEDNHAKSFIYCLIFINKSYKDIDNNDFTDLEKAKRLDPDNPLPYVEAVKHYGTLGKFDDVIRNAQDINFNKLSTEQKIDVYIPLLIAQKNTNNPLLTVTMDEFLKLSAKITPQKSKCYIFIGAKYTAVSGYFHAAGS